MTIPAGQLPPQDSPSHVHADGGIEWIAPPQITEALAAMLKRGIRPCREGQPVARLAPAAGAAPGAEPAVTPGPWVRLDAGTGVFTARRAGHVRLLAGKLDVHETLQWDDPVDASGGPFSFDGDMVFTRSIGGLGIVRGGKRITVNDCIETADVCAAGDIVVRRGICGKERGLVRAGGDVTARFLGNARVIAGGDVVVENEIDNSAVDCGRLLRCDRGNIMSGHMMAAGGINCHTAGTPAGVQVILELGITPQQEAEIKRLTEACAVRRQKVNEIRGAIEPLMARQKSLTAAQKEKATELLFSADEMETQAAAMEKDLAALRGPLEAALNNVIKVASLLHAGTIVRYPGFHARVQSTLRGPLTVRLLSGAQRCIVATDDIKATQHMLHPLDPARAPGHAGPSTEK